MSSAWDWPGSRWWRVDLHAHSPASLDFGSNEDREARDWARWVAAAKLAGLDAVAVTDHNSPNGILGIQEAARQAGGLVIFPGVEVTVGGVHLLCLLDPSRGRDDIVALLARLEILPEHYGRDDAGTSKSLLDTLKIAHELGAVCIAAHINGPKGLLSLTTAERGKALESPRLAAVELAPPTPSRPDEWLDPQSHDVQSWLQGKKTGGRVLTQIQTSDGHQFDQIGRRSAWFKMTRPDLEGLRLALLDGEASVRPYAESSAASQHAAQVIESIEIADAKYIGRGEALTIGFNPWLNAIIGGRGTGKSTVVDLLRKSLRRDDELPGSGEPTDERGGTLRDDFDQRLRVPQSRAEKGLLTDKAVVKVVYRKDGDRFLLSWSELGELEPIQRIEGDLLVQESGEIRERFPVRIYSQKQLFELARNPNALLAVIDESSEVHAAELVRQRRTSQARYLSLTAEARALRERAAELPAREAALSDVRRKLELLQAGGHAETLNDYRARRRQAASWESIQAAALAAVSAVQDGTYNLAVAELDGEALLENDPAFAALERAHESLRNVVVVLEQTIRDGVEKALDQIATVLSGADSVKWEDSLAASESMYREVTSQLSAEGISSPDEYGDLLQRSSVLKREIAELKACQKLAAERDEEAVTTLRKYRETRRELTNRRELFVSRASNEHVRIEILSESLRENLLPTLRQTLRIDRFDSDYLHLLKEIDPAEKEPWDFARLDKTVGDLHQTLAGVDSSWQPQDRRFEPALRRLQPEQLDRLALYLPDDAVEVHFRNHGKSGGDWKKLDQGSPGQQTAALLAFVLGYGGEPIVLDQPEDDLDNALIYELVVGRLRAVKPDRQIIVVTHNANIVVHGDAELVVSLEVAGGQTRAMVEGGLQEGAVREEVCRVMEGGRRAFEERYRRIMIPDGSESA